MSVLSAPAQAQESGNIYRNTYGTGDTGGIAGPVLNPGGEGQVVIGTYYDVRLVDGDAQHTNVQILNRNTRDDSLPECVAGDFARGVDGVTCYNPNGGILARVRFRESLESTPAFNFALALGCGEVWAGALTLGADDLPQLRSVHPVVSDENLATFVTSDLFTTPAAFTMERMGDAEDWQRGFFEVIGIESLPCLPRGGAVEAAGNTWDKLPTAERRESTNALSGKVFLVRAAAGISFSYEAPALARFVTVGGGPIPLGGNVLDNLDRPTLEDCLTYAGGGVTPLSALECISAVNLAISSSEAHGQFDIESGTGGQTRIVATLPTRSFACSDSPGSPRAPFECLPQGEEVACTVHDRVGSYNPDPLQPPPLGGIPPPAEPFCRLPRDLSILAVRDSYDDPAADFSLWTWELPAGSSGGVEIDLARDAGGALIHREYYAENSDILNVLGPPVRGYQGLPLLGVVVQEFENGNVGGHYGNTVALGSFGAVVYSAGGS
jgi:hypothetical protein